MRDGGVARYDGTAIVEVFNTQSGLINDRPQALVVAADGDLWVATDYGVSQYTHVQPSNIADLNNDGMVNAADLLILMDNWGACPAATSCLGDLDGNGEVNIGDLLILLANWG